MENSSSDKSTNLQWQLNAVSEVLGDLSLTINDSLTVGRGSDNDLVLGSKRISREHAKLYVVNGQLYIKDLQSSNGTFINEVALTAHKSTKVNADDLIGFANFQFQAKQGIEQASSATEVDATNDDIVVQNTESQHTETADTAAKQSTASSEKPTTPVNPIVDDVVTEKPVTPEATESQPTTAETTDTAPASTENTAVESNAESKVIETAVQDTESSTTKVAAPVNPLDTSVEDSFEKPSAGKKDTAEPADTTESLGQDKTTETTLQQAADPDVLRAKQAATGQFAPAENNDIGTNNNKAVDQAATNPATHPEQSVAKKGSGSWFIWVFLLIIIIAAVVWLLQSGVI